MILGFGLVIFIHELGHFVMARRNGVFVEKFAIGFDFFGAKLFTWHRDGTEYVIGAFPLGGYVKMKGQLDLPEDGVTNEDPDSYQSKTVWQRSQIISAGVIANFLSAFALCWFALVVGYHSYPAEVGSLSYETLEAGLRPGDQITYVDGKKVGSWEDLVLAYATREPGVTIPVMVDRAGTTASVDIVVHRDPRLPINYPDFRGSVELRVGSFEVGSAADRAGIRPGDLLLAVDGHPIATWAEFQHLIQHRPDADIIVTIERGDERLELQAHTESRTPDQVPVRPLLFEPDHPAVLDYVDEGSPAWQAGLRSGDLVLAVAGQPVASWYGLWRRATWEVAEGTPVPLTVQRGEDAPFDVAVTPGRVPDWGLGTTALAALGVAGQAPDQVTVGALLPGAPEQLRVGDRIVAVKGQIDAGKDAEGVRHTTEWGTEEPSWDTLLILANKLAAPTFELEVERDDKRHTFEIALTEDPSPVQMGFLGVAPLSKEILVRKGPVEALLPSFKGPFRILKDFVDGMRAMAMRRASARMLAGPVGILQATYSYAEKSMGDLANFLALLSVNLAIVNFLPIPITDGGHFVFLMYEKLKGRRMDEELEARFQWAGLVFILLVFLFATFNDVGRIFGF